jgi:hypothetical protein
MNTQSVLFAAALLIGCSAGHAQTDLAAATPYLADPSPTVRAAAVEDTARFADAMQLYRDGRWSAAYGRFLVLADRGNIDAARIALLMLRHGREMYDTDWTAAPSQVADWERMVGSSAAMKVAVHGE